MPVLYLDGDILSIIQYNAHQLQQLTAKSYMLYCLLIILLPPLTILPPPAATA